MSSIGQQERVRRTIAERVAAVRERVGIAQVVGGVVPLGRGHNARGKCPFHGSKSDSFTVYPDSGRARCWGCGWSGDAIRFVEQFYALPFVEALDRLEAEHGLDGLTPSPARRAKQAPVRRSRQMVSSREFGRYLWDLGVTDPGKLRVYLRARGVPDAQLGDDRLIDIRFVTLGPIAAWPVDGGPDDVAQAPAMVALVRRAPGGAGRPWEPIGAHITFLQPSLTGKMERRRRNGDLYPARKMAGRSAGGCVVLGRYAPDAPLFPGEGIESVLSGLDEAGAGPEACGVAVLSLDNLQGPVRLIRGAIPLYAPAGDPARGRAVAWAHRGPVTGLMDADMKPLPGPLVAPADPSRGHRGVAVIERKGGPIVHRTISSAERTELCAALFTAAWRGEGCAVGAIRPRMGCDFNDQVRGAWL